MTLRYRIANWLSHGMLFENIEAVAHYHNTLELIIERGNTKAPNSTVRDMVRIAQEGLER